MIYDELDLTLGTFKIRERGSPAGHNGARSVTGALGSQEWLRLRIGVGLDLPPEAIARGGRRPGRDYLLSPMRKADLTVLDEVLDRVATATRRILEKGPAAAMNEFNRKEDRDQGLREARRSETWRTAKLRSASVECWKRRELQRKRNTDVSCV